MGKIDIAKIEGFENMDADQLREYIGNLEIPDAPDLSQYVTKAIFDKTAHDLSEAKKTIAANLSAEQLAAEEKKKHDEEQAELVRTLTRRVTIADTKESLLEKGFSGENATALAEAMTDADNDKILAALAKHTEEIEKKAKENAMRGNPLPGGGGKPESDLVEKAKNLGKSAAKTAATTEDVFKNYIK